MRAISCVLAACLLGTAGLVATETKAQANVIPCGQNYTVVSGDTLTRISRRAYASPLYQPIYNANVETIGTNPNLILVGQVFIIPCLAPDGTAVAETEPPAQDDEPAVPANTDQIVLTFSKASAPPFIINSGIVDLYLAEITEVTEGRVTFVAPEETIRDHSKQFELVTSGAVDGAYVLNTHLAESHPLLQLPMVPMFGGSAEQTAVSMWRLHEEYLSQADYFPEAELLGFIAAPAAHIWRESRAPVTAAEGISAKNEYHVPYFYGLDTRGPAVMRTEFAALVSDTGATRNQPPAFFMAHGAALALGLWTTESNVMVTEVDNGLYTPTFSVILSNAAWAQISEEDRQAIRAVSGEKLAHRSASWDAFDNGFRSKMLSEGLDFKKADRALLDNLWANSIGALQSWFRAAVSLGIPANEAINFYLGSLRSLEDTLIFRDEEESGNEQPFLGSGN